MTPEQIESALRFLDTAKNYLPKSAPLYKTYCEQIEFLLYVQRMMAAPQMNVEIKEGK